jgi:RNA polymerase sigma-70 factor, ECF subfamily
MTAAMQLDGASAPMLAWVRAALVVMADTTGDAKETGQVARADEALLADLRSASGGDGDAYARIIGRYQDTIARRMLRFTRDPRMQEELVHDVFVEAYFGLAGYRGEAPFEHWLQRIATRVGFRYWTRRGRGSLNLLDIRRFEPEAAPRADALESADEVAVVLEQLAPRDRLVLTLLYLESRSVAEAADLAGWSESMVKVQAHRARKRFRKLLEASRPSAEAEENTDG